ncbi:MAG TPA: glutathione synthase [Methylophilus sp.]|nr:glutathione synthase [Methylophilus sp.]HQQ33019.1 glutathione synthase [Methylophilus sp.]
MKLLFILDPLESLKIYKDSSVAIMREAVARGYQLFVCRPHDLLMRKEKVFVQASPFAFADTNDWYALGQTVESDMADFDVVLNRKDPPFDNEYLYLTHLLEQAVNQGARVINNPSAVRAWNEKLSVAKFPEFAPAFIVTSQEQEIRAFLAEFQNIVVKPLDGMGGSGVFRLTENDPNIGSIIETITQQETRTVMAQVYLPEIKAGDKRILVIDGEPLPYALARIPKAGELRANLAAGGTGVAQPLSMRDWKIARNVGKVLKREGLFLVGLDVIGDYLTEINVTSPTCMVEIAAQTLNTAQPCIPAQVFVDKLQEIIK